MAIIPLNQSVTYTPITKDAWGDSTKGTPVNYDARVTEKSEVVKNQVGEEVISNLRITLGGLADVDYTGTFKYTNELGATVERQALSIKVTRDLGGNPLLTVVKL